MKLNVKHWTALAILLLAAIGAAKVGYARAGLHLAVALGGSLAFDYSASRLRGGAHRWSALSPFITGLIIGAVLAVDTAWWKTLTVALAAVLSKHFVRFHGRHLFNPAGFGLLFGAIMLGAHLVWWGDSWQAAVILIGSLLLWEFDGHWGLVFAYLLSLAGLIFVETAISGEPFIARAYFHLGSSFFFVFFMLTDPMTSPFRQGGRMIFGVVAAAGTLLSLLIYPPSAYIGGLLLANLCVPFLNRPTAPKPAPAAPPVSSGSAET